MMHLLKFLLPIAFMAAVNEASHSKRNELSFVDSAPIEMNGFWYGHRLQEDSNPNLACLSGNISKPGVETIIEFTAKLASGENFATTYFMEINAEPEVSLTFLNRNEDGSKGSKVCDMRCTGLGVVLHCTALPRCQFSAEVSFTAVCGSTAKQLDLANKHFLNVLCPPNTYFNIPNNC